MAEKPSPTATTATKNLIAYVSKKHADVQSTISHGHRVIEPREPVDLVVWFFSETVHFGINVLEYVDSAAKQAVSGLSNQSTLARRLPSRLTPSPERAASISNLTYNSKSRLEILVAILDEWQIFNRLWGLLDTWEASKKLVSETLQKLRENETVDLLDTFLRALEQLCSAGYYLGEALAYFTARKLLKWSPKTEDRLQYLSVRSWVVGIFAAIVRRLLELQRRRERGVTEKDESWQKEWNREFYNNLVWVPAALNYSVRGGIFPPVVASALGMYASARPVWDLWADTA